MSLDQAPYIELVAVVTFMQALGKSCGVVIGEFRSDWNVARRSVKAFGNCWTFQRDGSNELARAVSSILHEQRAERGAFGSATKALSAVESRSRAPSASSPPC